MPPVVGSVISTTLAASSVRFSASGVLTSGFSPSLGMARPKSTRINCTALPATILPAFSNSSEVARGTMMTSKFSPARTRFRISPVSTTVMVSWWPVSASNFALVSASTSRMSLAEITLISAALHVEIWLMAIAPMAAAAARGRVRMDGVPLFLLDRKASRAEVDVDAFRLLLVLVELITQHGDHHDQRADDEIKDVAA